MSIQDLPNIKKLPYITTKVSAVDSRVAIIRLIEKYGIESHMWAVIEGKEAIQFQISTVAQGVQVKKMIRIDIPIIKAKKWKGGSWIIVEVPRTVVLRFVFYILKGILEATQYGIFKLEHLLLAYTLAQIDGKIRPIKDILEEHPLLLATGLPKGGED